jgi:hypothetical protein
MNHLRVCNLRCLADTKAVDLKPISLLVGANSSGKSSFLRVFPLLKQSTEARTLSGLLLNEGDVSFGFFHEALRRDANPAELKFEFCFTLKSGIAQGRNINRFLLEPITATCELAYTKRVIDSRYPFLRSVRILLGSGSHRDSIAITADEDGKIDSFNVNDLNAGVEANQFRLRIRRGLVPGLVRVLSDKEPSATIEDDEVAEIGPFERLLLECTNNLFHGRAYDETRLATLLGIKIGAPQKMLTAAKEISGGSYWSQRIQNWTLETPTFQKIRNLLLARATGDLLSSINLQVSQLARSVHYFQPVRASVQRDYVSRDVQLDHVDPIGVNVAMVLASLKPAAQAKFRAWTNQHFGFEVFPQSVSDGARVSLRMKETNTGTEFNLADMGFGFSQMLPFLVQMWHLIEYEPSRIPPHLRQYYKSNESALSSGYIIAIEQPELHLHPALQARLADLFVSITNVSRAQNIPVRFMLETHSSTIIERIGRHIEAKNLPADDVQILLFERGLESQHPNDGTVRRATFNSDGILEDWPFGFLSPPSDPLPSSPKLDNPSS